MVLVPDDGPPGGAADWTGLEMLPDPAAATSAPSAPPGRRPSLQGLPFWSAVAAVLLVPGFIGGNIEHWARSPRQRVPPDAAVAVFVVDVSSSQGDRGPITATVSLRNSGSRTVTLLALSAGGGTGRPFAGKLPLALVPETVTAVPLNFDTCSASPSWAGALDAEVRVAGDPVRAVSLQVVGHEDDVRVVERAVADACAARRALSGP